jgi:RimJ/RimL family protein N-acetyltransferase
MTLPIQSKRLILRRFSPADIPDLLEFVAHPSVANEVQEMGTTEAQIQKYIALQKSFQPFEPHKVFDLAIERITDQKLIGIVTTICKHHRKAEIGYGLGIAHRGRGYATEAARALIGTCFDELGLHRIQAIASSGNPDSVQVLQRLGMKLEGRLREANLRDGKWCDLLYFGMLENEWRSKQG